MSFLEVEQEALALSDKERARLAVSLLDTLPAPGAEISDEEVWQRDADLESGKVTEISHDEFVRRVERDRRP
jgi:hypothetical protein